MSSYSERAAESQQRERDRVHGMTPVGTGNSEEHEPMLRWFTYGHLSDKQLRDVSRIFSTAALALVESVPRSAERTVALRKLLEAKDAAVRAALPEEKP